MASESLTLRECLLASAIEEANDLEVSKLKERIKTLEEALKAIKNMTPKRITDEFVQGPAVLLRSCQEIARTALGEKPETMRVKGAFNFDEGAKPFDCEIPVSKGAS